MDDVAQQRLTGLVSPSGLGDALEALRPESADRRLDREAVVGAGQQIGGPDGAESSLAGAETDTKPPPEIVKSGNARFFDQTGDHRPIDRFAFAEHLRMGPFVSAAA